MAALHDPVPSTDPSIEVVVMWGDDPSTADVLHVGYVPADRPFTVGDAVLPDGVSATDYLIDQAQLGISLLPIVVQSDRGPLLVVPTGSSLRTVSDQGVPRTAAELLLDDALCGSGNPRFPFALPIVKGMNAWLSYRGFTFVVRQTTHEKPLGTGYTPDWKAQRFTMASVAAHLFLLALFYYAPPASSAMASDAITMRQTYLDYTVTVPEVEIEPLPDFDEGGGTPSDSDKAPSGDQGTLGEPEAKAERSKKTSQASLKSDSKLTPDEARELLRQDSIYGAILAHLPVGEGAFNASSASGTDRSNAVASLLATNDGPSFGNGLGPFGTGRGAGGTAAGTVASGFLKTRGVGGPGTGGSGYGTGVGRLGGRGIKIPPAPKGVVQVTGSLSKETIRRTIHRNLNQVRFCYEQGLQTKPDLQGRVAVSFIIDPSGAVKVAATASSNLANAQVDSCIVSAVKRWSFAQPSGGGIVSVTYPFVLEQVGQ